MRWTWAAVLGALWWAATAAADPLKVVVPDFNAVGPSRERAVFFTEHLSGRLAEVGAQVTTQRQLAQLLGIERQRQLLGCSSEAGSCLAELANALGTDALVLGDVAQIDTLFQLNLKLISGADSSVLSTHQARVSSEGALLDELDKAAYALVSEGAQALRRDAPRALKHTGPSLRMLAIAPAGVAVAAGVASAVLFSQAAVNYARIPQRAGDAPLPVSEAERLASLGNAEKVAGWVCAGVGVAAAAAAAVMFVLGRPTAPKASAAVVLVPGGGAALVVGGEL